MLMCIFYVMCFVSLQFLWQKLQSGKNLPAMQETGVWSQGREDPLGKGMATQSSILVWEIPWTEGSGGLQSVGVAKSQT